MKKITLSFFPARDCVSLHVGRNVHHELFFPPPAKYTENHQKKIIGMWNQEDARERERARAKKRERQ